MPEAAEFEGVVYKLLDKAREDKLDWEEYGPGFAADLPGGYKFVASRETSQGDTTYELLMRDDRGRMISSLSLTDDPDTLMFRERLYKALAEIYELARRKALHVNEKLEKVTDILDKI